MGSTSIILGEVVAPTSAVEFPPPASTVRGGLPTLESAAGGEVALLSTDPRGGEAVRASSAKASPTTVGSGDLVQEGEVGAHGSPCGSVTGLYSKHLVRTSIHKTASTKRLRSQEFTW
jgi:hypothetical protein